MQKKEIDLSLIKEWLPFGAITEITNELNTVRPKKEKIKRYTVSNMINGYQIISKEVFDLAFEMAMKNKKDREIMLEKSKQL